jgi:hypothetical protein
MEFKIILTRTISQKCTVKYNIIQLILLVGSFLIIALTLHSNGKLNKNKRELRYPTMLFTKVSVIKNGSITLDLTTKKNLSTKLILSNRGQLFHNPNRNENHSKIGFKD